MSAGQGRQNDAETVTAPPAVRYGSVTAPVEGTYCMGDKAFVR